MCLPSTVDVEFGIYLSCEHLGNAELHIRPFFGIQKLGRTWRKD